MNFDSNVVVQCWPEIEDSYLSKHHPDPWEVELAILPGTSRVTILPRGWKLSEINSGFFRCSPNTMNGVCQLPVSEKWSVPIYKELSSNLGSTARALTQS